MTENENKYRSANSNNELNEFILKMIGSRIMYIFCLKYKCDVDQWRNIEKIYIF